MNFYEISSLPSILFSHSYKADVYNGYLSIKENLLEVSYIVEGTLDFEVDGIMFSAKKGDVVCAFHNTKTYVSAEKFHCHHTVCGVINWKNSSEEETCLCLPKITPSENGTSNICRLIDDIIQNHELYKTKSALGSAKFLELLCAVDKCNRKIQNQNTPGEILYTSKAKEYILKNIRTPITQKSIAKHLNISPEYLCTIFKKTEGTTIMRYINRIKLENIKTLIDHMNLNLYEAAAMYGYNDPNYVSRLYKQLFGYNITDKTLIRPEIK